MKRYRLIWKWAFLCSAPVAVAAGLFLFLRARNEGPYVAGGEEEGVTRSLSRSVEEGASGIRFTEVTREAGIRFDHFPFVRTSQLPEDMGSGLAWGDYDGDGLPDLFLVNFAAPVGTSDAEMEASPATDRLFRNLGDGTFENVTATAGVRRAHRGMGVSWADYDGDGDPDLFVTSWGENVLWENRGNGTFRDVTAAAGLSGEGFWTGPAWADIDLDGDLDLYVCGYVDYVPEEPGSALTSTGGADFPFTLNPSSYPPSANRLYINNGDGTFDERAEAAGVLGQEGRSLAAAWVDLDADGLPDLYVANDVSDNRLYLNRGDGSFEDVSYQALVADYRGAMGVAAGDWDADLDVDLFIPHWIAQENALYSNQLAELSSDTAPARLFFGDDADRFGLGQISLDLIGWGTSFVDVDNDGSLDLFVSNGSTFQDRDDPTRLLPMHPHLYWNRGPTEGFFEVGEHGGIRTDPAGVGRGAAFADYDRDGDPDLAILRHGQRARLLRNDAPGGHRIALRLKGTSSHPSALGARVLIHAGDRTLLRLVGAQAPYLSQNDRELIVGLGQTARVDSIEVRWPGGSRQVWTDITVDGQWLLTEGSPARLMATLPGRGTTGAATAEPEPGASEYAIRSRVDSTMSRAETRRFWSLSRQAGTLYNEGRWTEAVEIYREMLALDPTHEDARYNLGNSLLELGHHGEAVEAWRTLLEVNPSSSRARVQIGVVHTLPEAGTFFDLEAALGAFRQAHRINREESRPLILMGETALAMGDRDEASTHLEAAYRMNGQAISALYLAGYLAWKGGDASRATTLLGRAVTAREPRVPEGMSNEGDTRSRHMMEARRRAAQRRLFAECVDGLPQAPPPPDPGEAYACVDRVLAALPVRR